MELKTGLINLFIKVRSDVPRETLEIEAGMFIAKYGNKDLYKDINLINTWAKKIRYTPPVNQSTEFDRIAKLNQHKYGS